MPVVNNQMSARKPVSGSMPSSARSLSMPRARKTDPRQSEKGGAARPTQTPGRAAAPKGRKTGGARKGAADSADTLAKLTLPLSWKDGNGQTLVIDDCTQMS